MKSSGKTAIWVSIIVAVFSIGAVSPNAEAISKSATIHVSCTILPLIEVGSIAAPERTLLGFQSDKQGVHVGTNLGSNYKINESFRHEGAVSIKTISVTAL